YKKMKVRFILPKDKIYLSVNVNGKRLRLATNIMCEPHNFEKGYPKRGQTLIIEEVRRIEKIVNEHLATDNYTVQSVREIVDVVLGKTTNSLLISKLITDYKKYKYEIKKVTQSTKDKIELHLTDFNNYMGVDGVVKDITKDKINTYLFHL